MSLQRTSSSVRTQKLFKVGILEAYGASTRFRLALPIGLRVGGGSRKDQRRRTNSEAQAGQASMCHDSPGIKHF